MDSPQDVYSGIAELVDEQVKKDAAAGSQEARMLLGNVDRKLVKQTVRVEPCSIRRPLPAPNRLLGEPLPVLSPRGLGDVLGLTGSRVVAPLPPLLSALSAQPLPGVHLQTPHFLSFCLPTASGSPDLLWPITFATLLPLSLNVA